MNCVDEGLKTPFPLQRPGITIVPSEDPPFEVDFRELAWWFAIPEVGDHTLWSLYDPPEWKLTAYEDLRGLRPAIVHGIDGVEIAFVEYVIDDKNTYPQTIFARVTEDRVQWLATILQMDGKTKLNTLLDDKFDKDWGERQRRVRHTGRFLMQSDGSWRQCANGLIDGETIEGMDVCHITIGSRSFSCLRVIDVEHEITENSVMLEAYLTREGRTVLCRRYNGRMWQYGGSNAGKVPWDERFPTHNRIVIDGVTFVHWYDCLSGFACGIDADSL